LAAGNYLRVTNALTRTSHGVNHARNLRFRTQSSDFIAYWKV